TLASELSNRLQLRPKSDSLKIDLDSPVGIPAIQEALASIRQSEEGDAKARIDESALEGVKFSECLPPEIALGMLARRLADPDGVAAILRRSRRFVSDGMNEVGNGT